MQRSNNMKGYYKINLYQSAYVDSANQYHPPVPFTCAIHTLVYWAWVGPIETGMTIDHVDGRRHNNDISNLEQVTFEENLRRRNIRNADDDSITTSRWSEREVHQICRLLQARRSYGEVAEALGISSYDKSSPDYQAVVNVCKAIMD